MSLKPTIIIPEFYVVARDDTTTLKLEKRFDAGLVSALKSAGHEVEILPEFSDLTGHAGALVLHPNGLVETATDPRADGAALSF